MLLGVWSWASRPRYPSPEGVGQAVGGLGCSRLVVPGERATGTRTPEPVTLSTSQVVGPLRPHIHQPSHVRPHLEWSEGWRGGHKDLVGQRVQEAAED